MTSTRRNSFSLIAVLATAASSTGRSLGDISNVDGRGHFQRGSTGESEGKYEWRRRLPGHVERTIEVSGQTAADVLAEVGENGVLLARIFGGHSSFKRDENPFGRLPAKTNSLASDRAILHSSRRFT